MKLMDILKEVEVLEKKEVISEAKKQAKENHQTKIKKQFKAKTKQSEAIAKTIKVTPGNIKWPETVIELRNEIVAAFLADDAGKVIKMMEQPDGYKTVEILKALAKAHKGYNYLEKKAQKAGKGNFIKEVYAYVDTDEENKEEEKNDK